MTQTENKVLSPVLFLPHGGGPLPLFGDEGHKHLTRFLSGLASQIDKPAAILIISAHWEENQPVITSKAKPGLYYDYYNFPEETYHIDYPLAGCASLTQKVEKLLAGQGFDARLDDQRDFDHGVFVPLKLVYPDADIPCVQLSLVNTLDPQFHIQIGRALAPLRAENVLIIGSGLTFHNMGAFFAPDAADVDKGNNAFQDWLIDVCTSKLIDEKQREQRLTRWDSASSARYCHPREEHLLPLHVCYGAAGSAADLIFDDDVLGKKTCGFLWQAR
ncbi:MAG: dioxygenase [Porticoccaceae bacterium]|nr:dioxygenase [Porticoccaceae bacterium]